MKTMSVLFGIFLMLIMAGMNLSANTQGQLSAAEIIKKADEKFKGEIQNYLKNDQQTLDIKIDRAFVL